MVWRAQRSIDAARRAALADNAQALGEQASHDMLTGLANRRQLMSDLGEAVSEQRRVALALIDLDGFKASNDTFGHAHGDLLLERVGRRLSHAVAAGTVYRLGGDEFCALLPDDANLAGALQAVRDALRCRATRVRSPIRARSTAPTCSGR